MEITKTLRKARKRAGISQEELSIRMDYTQTHISRLENGSRRVTWDDAVNWAKQTNANDLLIAAMIGADVANVQQITEFISQLSQYIGFAILGGIA